MVASHRRLLLIHRCCCASPTRRAATTSTAAAGRGAGTALPASEGAAASSIGAASGARASVYGESPTTPYRYREDGHPLTAHAGVTAAHALGVVHEIIQRCRSQAVLTTHGEPSAPADAADPGSGGGGGGGGIGMTTRVVGVKFDGKDPQTGKDDLRRLTLTTNPQTRKAAQLMAAASGGGGAGLTFCFFDTRSEGFVVLYGKATAVKEGAECQAVWDDRFPTPAMTKRAEGIFPGGANGGNFAAFVVEVVRIEMINHDVSEEDGMRGDKVIADHPIGWRPLALCRADKGEKEEQEQEQEQDVGDKCGGWKLEEEDGRVMIV